MVIDYEAFIDFRNMIIDRLEKNEITKEEFIIENYEYIKDFMVNPYEEVKTIKEGIFKYQFFNSNAKYCFLKSHELEHKAPRRAYNYREDGFQNYRYKDNVIKEILELIAYKNVKAYFIEMDSEFLNGELYEIVLEDYNKVIFHTKDLLILNRLKNNKCFIDEIRPSVISNYINSRIHD